MFLTSYGKLLSCDSGQSIYLALSHFIYKTVALEPAVRIYTKDWQRASYSCRHRITLRDAVHLARLRAGQNTFFKASVNQPHTTADRNCPSCGEEPQAVEH